MSKVIKLFNDSFYFDYHRLKKNLDSSGSGKQILNRNEIANIFNSFNTNWSRIRFVRYLQSQKVIATGTWPDGKLPNINNDEASTLLAQMEEKWLGLDR